MQWFRAKLDGHYHGQPHAVPRSGAHAQARGYRLQVYRAELRDLSFTEPPEPDVPEPAADAPLLRQAQLDVARVAGVRGPGSMYEGPIFDLRIRGVQLTHAAEHAGRAYGRIRGDVIGWLELPPPPPPPKVEVQEIATAAPAEPPKPLQATLTTQAVATPNELAASSATAPHALEGDADLDAALEANDATPPAASAHTPSMLWLCSLTALVALGLWIGRDANAVGLWALFMMPTLIARRLLYGVLPDSVFTRGVGAVLIAIQWLCLSSFVPGLGAHDCVQPNLFAMLGVVLVVFPTALLPSVVPISLSALGLALGLAASCL